ncbi:MAG: aldehyde dehydrogenase family protein, partial [Armatimonadota bacterium]
DDGRGEWPTMPVAGRIRAMEKFIEKMKLQREEVVERLMWEIGKTLKDSQNEFDRTVKYIEDTVDALKDQERDSARLAVENQWFAQIRRSPFGPTLCMGPYNYPLNETFATLIPAIITGNPVVSKLPRYGVLLNMPLLEAFAECFPPGVVNIISGRGNEICSPLVRSGRVSVLAFIGSSKTADILKREHPHPHRFRSVLSLDAKNPAIVLESADLDVAVQQVLLGALSFNGQRCTALKLIYVHDSLADKFTEKLSEAVNKLKSGLPWGDGVRITPVADYKGAPKFLGGLLEDAVKKGAEVANAGGGEMMENYFHPAVVTKVSRKSDLFHIEQFGPLIPVIPFKDVEEVIRDMVESPFGQQVSVFGQDPKVMGPLIDQLVNQVSRINLNTQCQRGPDTFPFTGRKASAEGTLSVTDALKRFSIRSLVATDYADENRDLVNGIFAARSSKFLNTDFVF